MAAARAQNYTWRESCRAFSHGHPVYKEPKKAPPDRNPRLLGPSSESAGIRVSWEEKPEDRHVQLLDRVRSVVAFTIAAHELSPPS